MVRASFIITSGYTLIGVRHCSALFRCRPRPWKSARNWNNCGRLKQECVLMWRSLTQLHWVLILLPIWQWHARYSPDNIENHQLPLAAQKVGIKGNGQMNTARTGKIGFQGAKGANSEIAIHQLYPKMAAVPFDTFEDVFNALEAADIN